jgi:hypothetical protein
MILPKKKKGRQIMKVQFDKINNHLAQKLPFVVLQTE